MAERTAQEIWIDDKARSAGHADGAAFARAHGLKNYRLQQLYRAAAKEFVPDVASVSVLPLGIRPMT